MQAGTPGAAALVTSTLLTLVVVPTIYAFIPGMPLREHIPVSGYGRPLRLIWRSGIFIIYVNRLGFQIDEFFHEGHCLYAVAGDEHNEGPDEMFHFIKYMRVEEKRKENP